MSILLVAPDSFRGQTQGLMGTWNGNASDDFLTPQGSLLSPNLTTEQLHYQFGLLCKIIFCASNIFLSLYINFVNSYISFILISKCY